MYLTQINLRPLRGWILVSRSRCVALLALAAVFLAALKVLTIRPLAQVYSFVCDSSSLRRLRQKSARSSTLLIQ